MMIKLRVRSAYVVPVGSPSTDKVYVQWHRGKESSKTDAVTVGAADSKARWKTNFKISPSFYLNKETGVWRADPSELVLFCAGEKVGTCRFDFTSFIGLGETKTVAKIQANESGNPSEIVMVGNAIKYPGASIEFIITCETKDQSVMSIIPLPTTLAVASPIKHENDEPKKE